MAGIAHQPVLTMTSPQMITLTSLIDDAKCYELIRHYRWPDGVRCTSCSSATVIRHGHDETQRHRQRYRCKDCAARFDDLSGTVLARHHQPLRAWILCLYFMGLNLVWAFQSQAVSYSSFQCVHPYVRSEEPSLRPDHDPGQTPAGAEVKDGRQATAAGGASLRSAPAGVTLGGLGGGADWAAGGRSAGPRRSSRVWWIGSEPRDPTTLYAVRRRPGTMMLYAHRRRGSREGGTILSIGLAPMFTLRYTTHLGHAGPPGLPVSRARVSPARGRNGQVRRP
jgi:transposase-like protein